MSEQASSNKPPFVLYNREGVPFEVYSLSAFCKEFDLPLEAMKNVAYGRTRRYRGWHLDEERTQATDRLAAQIEQWFQESEEQYGAAFIIDTGE